MNEYLKHMEAVESDLSNLAAEYALGVLQGPQRRHFEQLMAANPALKTFVLKWGGVFGNLEPRVEPTEPDDRDESMWQRLERRLDVEEKVMTRLHDHQLSVRTSLAVSIGALRVLRQRLAQRRAELEAGTNPTPKQ